MELQFKGNDDNQEDYLSKIKNEYVRKALLNFFEPSIISRISPKRLNELVDAINTDIENEIFRGTMYFSVNNFKVMSNDQLNSQTHQTFLKIVKESFGKSAVKLLKQRKNLNIFNLSEMHVLHQEVFDNFGEEFVNRVINNNVTPQSLIIIKNILSNKEEMANFKSFYDFYTKNIGKSQADFERMIRSYDLYKDLFEEIRKDKIKLSKDQKETLIDILNDKNNMFSVKSIEDVNNFYDIKNKKYMLDKQTAKSKFEKIETEGPIDYEKMNPLQRKWQMQRDRDRQKMPIRQLANSIFNNFFGVEEKYNVNEFFIANRSPRSLYRHFDLDDILKNNFVGNLTEDELDMLRDLYKIMDIVENKNDKKSFYELEEIAQKYENKGNKTSRVAASLFEKIPKMFNEKMIESITKVDEIKQRADNEEGIYVEKNPVTEEGEKVDVPVYVFDGADFAFLSTTNYVQGLSGNSIEGDFASSWFEYENGTGHISCSYSSSDNLCNLEFNRHYKREQVTYLFDEAQIYSMGSEDIYTDAESRISNYNSGVETKFMRPEKIIENTDSTDYNEVGISRFNYSDDMNYGGKIIPSAILCSEKITSIQLEAARSFTKFCVENGLRPKGWKMPIVVVNKEKYLQIQENKRKYLINKNNEIYSSSEEKKKEEKIDNKEEKKVDVKDNIKTNTVR